MLPVFSPFQWLLAVFAAFCIGFAKSGFPGVGLLTVILMARLFPPRESTGILLPLLICGDVFSVLVFHRHAQWRHIGRMLPPTLLGVGGGYFLMQYLPSAAFGPVIGGIVMLMVVLQVLRQKMSAAYAHVPHTRRFAWAMGAGSGIATMLANAAGPVMSLYFLAIQVPKYELVGTSAWFFLIVNLSKVPLSAHLNLITPASLLLNLWLVPAVALGILSGRLLVGLIPQRRFEQVLLAFAFLAGLRLLAVW
jgi:uncharacterized membrane protein YfcA